MGLKDKIKDALHGDKDDTQTSPTHAPGAYPSDTKTSMSSQDTSSYGYGQNTSSYGTGQYQKTDDLSSSHRPTDSGVDFGSRTHDASHRDRPVGSSTNDPYWGNVDSRTNEPGLTSTTTTGTTTATTTDTGYGYGSSNRGPHDSNAANKLDPRVDSDRDNRAAYGTSTTGTGYGTSTTGTGYGSSTGTGYGSNTNTGYGDNYNSSSNRGPHDSNIANKLDPRVDSDRDNRAHRAEPNYGVMGTTGTSDPRHKDLPSRPRDQQAGYNDRTGPVGGGTYNTVTGSGSRDYQSGYDNTRDTTSSRDDRSGLGAAGLGAAGAGAGYAATRHHDDRDRNVPYDSRRAGPHDSDTANKVDPRVDSDRDGSRTMPMGQDQPRGMGGVSGPDTTTPAGLAASMAGTGMGPSHYGPGHEGAKVMHKCVGCGLDNDISQYFRKDAVYRMG